MSRKTKIALISVVLISAIIYFSVWYVSMYLYYAERTKDIVIQVAIVPPSRPITYHFVLRKDRTLTSSAGSGRVGWQRRGGRWREFDIFPFVRTDSILRDVFETVEIQLTEEEYYRLTKIADRLPEGGYTAAEASIFPLGFLDVYYNGALFFVFSPAADWAHTETFLILRELRDEIIELSPLEVDLVRRY